MNEPTDFYKKRYESAMHGIASLELRLDQSVKVITILEAEKKQWILEKIQQQQIIQQALNASNSTNNGYLEENKRLQEENRKLRTLLELRSVAL